MPVPMMHAVRSPRMSLPKSRPDCATASRAAISANCETRSSRTRRLESKCVSGSKPRTSAATLMLSSSVGMLLIGPIADRPAHIAAQVAAASCPSGQIAPIPVMATRRMSARRVSDSGLRRRRRCAAALFGEKAFDSLDESPDRLCVEVRVAIGQRDLIVVLDLENDLHGIERLNFQILERRVETDLAGIDAGFLRNDREDRFLHATHMPVSSVPALSVTATCAGSGMRTNCVLATWLKKRVERSI